MLSIAGVPPSTYSYRGVTSRDEQKRRGGRPNPGYCLSGDGHLVADAVVKEKLVEIIEAEGASYDYHKLTGCLKRRYGLLVNKKNVYRLCKAEGAALEASAQAQETPSQTPGQEPSHHSSQSALGGGS